MLTLRNVTATVPLAMWLYVVIATAFDVHTTLLAGVICVLSSLAIYVLPHTEREHEEVAAAFEALVELITVVYNGGEDAE